MAARSETPKHSSISSSNKGEGKISTPSPYKARSVSSCCFILILSSLALSAWSSWLVPTVTMWFWIGPKCRQELGRIIFVIQRFIYKVKKT
ncbi:hypothetical protein ATANTOWER_031434 [Ataeniobius toweri]|uniref:Uncharacterized protein n=1 Tax=Ataeniobius toweri TaxID=208326 RepID=A0ABU7A9H8_9TELE|nr:hypothetical protein [Ataeniobius toweri]